MTIAVRAAVPADRAKLKKFECSSGEDFEDEVEAYVRLDVYDETASFAEAIDQRLVVCEDETIVGVAAHRAQDLVDGNVGTFLIVGAVSSARQGKDLSNGRPASDVLMEAILDSIAGSPERTSTAVVGRVRDGNARSLAWCSRFGLRELREVEPGLIEVVGDTRVMRQRLLARRDGGG